MHDWMLDDKVPLTGGGAGFLGIAAGIFFSGTVFLGSSGTFKDNISF